MTDSNTFSMEEVRVAFNVWTKQMPPLDKLNDVERARMWFTFQIELIETKAAELNYAIGEMRGQVRIAAGQCGIPWSELEAEG